MRSVGPNQSGQSARLEWQIIALFGALACAPACARDFAKANDTVDPGSKDASTLDGGALASTSSASSLAEMTMVSSAVTYAESPSNSELTSVSVPSTSASDSESSSTGEPPRPSMTSGQLTSVGETSSEQLDSTAALLSDSTGVELLDASWLDAGPRSDANVATIDAGEGGPQDGSQARCAKKVPDGGLDTDGDAEADVDDVDDDDDGILDTEDTEPLDPAVPGGSGACGPAVVLNDPCMRQALEMTKELVDIPIHLEHCGLDISGYYLRPDLSGEFVTDNNGSPRGLLVGGEYRFTQTGELVQVAEVAFTSGVESGHSKSIWPIWVRGSAQGSTTIACSPSSVGISSGHTREDGGIADVWTLSVARAPLGSNECPENNSWILSFQSVLLRVAPHELDHMCSADDAAYIPSETWDSESGVCTCQDDLDVLCSHN